MWKLHQFFWKRIEVWLNVIFKVIDISMETIHQKLEIGKEWILHELDFHVKEKRMPISAITMLGREI